MTVPIGYGVELVTRAEWGARPPKARVPFTPTYGTTSHWEGPHMGAFPHSACASKVRGIQAFHMDSRGWSDLAYTAITCPHGFAFEGRWVGIRTAANGTNTGNSTAYACCYMSGIDDPFTDAGKRAQRAVIDYLDSHGAGPGRNCHRDWKSTECPGDVVCAWVRAGLPILTPPVPHPPTPTPTPPKNGDDKVLYLVQAPGGPMYLTDWLTKRAVIQEDVDVAQYIATGHGHPIQTNLVAGKPTGKPIPLGPTQADVLDRIRPA